MNVYEKKNPNDREFAKFANKLRDLVPGFNNTEPVEYKILVNNAVAYLRKCEQKWQEAFPASDTTVSEITNIYNKTVNENSIEGFWQIFNKTYADFIAQTY